MPDTTETKAGNGENTAQQARAEIQKEIETAKSGAAEEQEKKMEALALKLKEELKEIAKAADGREVKQKIGENASLKTIIRISEAAKAGIKVTSEKNEKFLTSLTEKGLTESTAFTIEKNLRDYLLGDKSIDFSEPNEKKTAFETDFETLKRTDSNAAKLVGETLINQAANFNQNENVMRNKFEVKPQASSQEEDETRREFETAMHRQENDLFGRYFDSDEDFKLLKAIYNPEEFIKYILEKKENLSKKYTNDEELSKKLTEDIEGEISALFGKIYQKLDIDHAKEFFEEITKKDFYSGIERASIELSGRLNILRNSFGGEKGKKLIKAAGLENFKFTKYTSDIPISETVKIMTGEKDAKGNERYIEKPRIRVQPLDKPTPINFEEFIHHLHINTENYIEFRRYVHNARSLFLHPPDKEGFYGKLGEYAEQFGMIDLDSMMALPDAEIFMTAFHLYDKDLEEMFASNDWKHHPTMFTRNRDNNFTDLELEVLKNLKIEYEGTDVSENRLRSALSMAVGASRGIFLNDPEKASFADPVKLDGKFNYASYYTEDNSPLSVFNPVMHLPYRFQSEGAMMHPLYFMSFNDAKTAVGGIWDHQKLWKEMQEFRDSFLKGRHTVGQNKQLFIDYATNIGKIGGPFERGGWRNENWFSSYYQYDAENKNLLLVKDTWQELENIGYEALSDFVNNNRMERNFLQESKSTEKRLDFFKYLYKQYFGKDAELEKYLGEIRNIARGKVYDDVSKNIRQPGNLEEEVEYETSKIFLFRTLSRVIAQRFPSKFLRIDRDRFDQEGKSRWNRIREKMNIGTHAEFDLVVKNFMLAEDLLRREVSKQMRDGVRAGKHLNQIEGIEYVLTEDKIRNQLLKGKINQSEIDKVIDFYKVLQTEYSNNNSFLNNFAKELQNGKYKFSFAVEEIDLSFVPFKAAGGRLLPRAIKDMALTEQALSAEIIKFPKLLHKVATEGKGDFSEIVATIQKAKEAVTGIIGPDYAAEVAYRMAAMTIVYFKKDTYAKTLFGVFGVGRINSMAGEFAGRSTAVWEWDAREIDRFCIALETQNILKREPYLWSSSKPTYVPRYIKIPFTDKMIKLPSMFNRKQREIAWTSKDLRDNFGAAAIHIAFELVNTVLPIVAIFFLWQLIQKSMEEFTGKKKQQ